jgi:hypothetical protein
METNNAKYLECVKLKRVNMEKFRELEKLQYLGFPHWFETMKTHK